MRKKLRVAKGRVVAVTMSCAQGYRPMVRTAVFGAVNEGSNPSTPATLTRAARLPVGSRAVFRARKGSGRQWAGAWKRKRDFFHFKSKLSEWTVAGTPLLTGQTRQQRLWLLDEVGFKVEEATLDDFGGADKALAAWKRGCIKRRSPLPLRQPCGCLLFCDCRIT